MSDETWLTDYLLGEGDPSERAEAERRIAADPELRTRAAQLSQVTQGLESLPAAAWESLEQTEAALDPVGVDTDRRSQPVRRRRRRRYPRPAAVVAALALVFCAGLGVGAAIWAGGNAIAIRQTIVLHPLAATSNARGFARLTHGGRLQVSVSGLAKTPPGRFYEAWLMTSTTRLVPLASFRVSADGHASVNVSPPAALSQYRYVDISLQRASDGTAHSRDSVLRGSTGG